MPILNHGLPMKLIKGTDISANTVLASTMLEGITSHDSDGNPITGTIMTYDSAASGGLSVVAEPTMYLYGHEADKTVSYNGVVLPELPVWDKTAYPYAIIGYSNVRENYVLKVSEEPTKVSVDEYGTYSVFISGDVLFEPNDGEWASTSTGVLKVEPIWANNDVYYTDSVDEVGGTVYLSASDPVTTYENADVTINGVGYVGAVLPKLPTWDKEQYPYAMIGNKEQSLSGLNILYICDKPFLGRTDYADSVLMQKNSNCNYYSVKNGEWVYVGVITVPNIGITSRVMEFPIWSNTDITYELDGNIEYAIQTTDPIPVELVGNSYNGYIMPELPNWDKETYPYAVILANAPYGLAVPEVGTAYLYLGNKPFYHGNFLVPYSLEFYESGVYQEYRLDTDVSNEFVLQKSVEVEALEKFGTSLFRVVWCNLDIYNTSSELYLTGSDPAPVYE